MYIEFLKQYAILVAVVMFVSWLFAHFIAIMRGQNGLYQGDYAVAYTLISLIAGIICAIGIGLLQGFAALLLLLGAGLMIVSVVAGIMRLLEWLR